MDRTPTVENSHAEREIETLVRQIEGVIGRAQAHQRRDLRAYASALLADLPMDFRAESTQNTAAGERRPFGLLAAGLALIVLGAALALLIPPIGMTLAVFGVLLAIWGAVAGWWMMPRGKG